MCCKTIQDTAHLQQHNDGALDDDGKEDRPRSPIDHHLGIMWRHIEWGVGLTFNDHHLGLQEDPVRHRTNQRGGSILLLSVLHSMNPLLLTLIFRIMAIGMLASESWRHQLGQHRISGFL